jgi:thioredoxin-related protein
MSFSQVAKVEFLMLKNWDAVLRKAKIENKYIFVDAYATWCGPCKEMDEKVYVDPRIGNYMNTSYISIKIQIDKSKQDSKLIKKWYDYASLFQKKNNIIAFPTLLFFNSNGELLNKATGYQDIEDFLSICKLASDSAHNFVGLMKTFNEGRLSLDQKIDFAIFAKKIGNDSSASKVAKEVIKDINNKNPKDILKPTLIPFMNNFLTRFKDSDKFIRYIYNNQNEADSLTKFSNFSSQIISYLIDYYLLDPEIYPNGIAIKKDPDWDKLEKKVSETWDRNNAKLSVINAKIKYYKGQQKWDKIVQYSIEQQDLNEINIKGINGISTNNMVWDVIFKHSNNSYQLAKGITYMEALLKSKPDDYDWLDTYANLLYKAGYKDKALNNEKKAVSIIENSDIPENDKNQKIGEFKKNIAKMENNLPTWE